MLFQHPYFNHFVLSKQRLSGRGLYWRRNPDGKVRFCTDQQWDRIYSRLGSCHAGNWWTGCYSRRCGLQKCVVDITFGRGRRFAKFCVSVWIFSRRLNRDVHYTATKTQMKYKLHKQHQKHVMLYGMSIWICLVSLIFYIVILWTSSRNLLNKAFYFWNYLFICLFC